MPHESKAIRQQEKLEITTPQVDTDRKHCLFLHEQLTYLHTENI